MVCTQGTCIDSKEPSNAPKASSCASSVVEDHYNFHNKLKFRIFLRNLIWDFGFACVAAPSRHSGSPKKFQGHGENDGNGYKTTTLGHNNKAWLLAESGGCEGAELGESFRFSFCSQVELESLNMSSSAAAAVLIVNLDYGISDSIDGELKRWKMEPLEKNMSPVSNTLIRFNYDEILYATRNFSKGRILGRGGLSCVYRGRDGLLGTSIAIKRLDKKNKESAKAFCRELMIASSLDNPNVVPLLGFCIDPEEGLFLVYKYVSGGSLEHRLHGRKKSVKGSSPLPCSVRYKVAIGIANAIAYLHNGNERCVVHRDIKPSNILLSSKKTPMLCDFGLASWTSAPAVPFLCNAIKGTFGYLAPEYFQHGKVSDKTDVYAFGVVLLELITGRKPIEAKRPPGEENLVLWAKTLLQKGKEAIKELLDPQLKCSLRFSNQIAWMIEAATACVTYEESRRPSMHEIIAILKGEEAPVLFSRRSKSGYLGNGCVNDCYPQLQQTDNEMESHLALAMLAVSEYEDDDYLYGC